MVYVKTELGRSALLKRKLMLTHQQRWAFILFDGKRSAHDVFVVTQGLGSSNDDLEAMVSQGLLTAVEDAPASHPSATGIDLHPPTSIPTLSPSATYAQVQYAKAYPIAIRLTAQLGLRGFLLNLAVETASDLDKLQTLAPKIREAVGMQKFAELESALYF